MEPHLMIYDNFLPEGPLLDKFADDDLWIDLNTKKTVYVINEEGHNGGYHYSYQFWDGKTEPKNHWEEFIKLAWIDTFKINEQYAGFEYWCNIIGPDDEGLSWHQDLDEKELDINNKVVHPMISSVYYGMPHIIEEGLLEIAMLGDEMPEARTGKAEYEPMFTTERICPFFNRLIVFNPKRWHRVMPVKKGWRFGFQVNIWKEQPSWNPLGTTGQKACEPIPEDSPDF